MRKSAGFLFLCLCIFGLTACAQTYFTGFRPESHLAFPNSNVVPLGLAKGDSELNCGMSPPFVTSAMQTAAVNNALQSKGGDLLLNYIEVTTYYNFPLVQCTKYSVEGTAAKMTIGSQKLN